MLLVLDLQNPNNWESRWVLDVQAENQQFHANGDPVMWTQIPEQTCPLLFTNPFVAVYCQSETKRASWRLGGFLIQKFSTGLVVGGSLNAVTSNGRKIFFDNLQLLALNGYANTYSLSFKIPYWHRDIKKEIDQQMNTELIVLTSRFQRNIDNNKINNGLLKVRVTDLERWASMSFGYSIRAEFPTDALPGDRTEL